MRTLENPELLERMSQKVFEKYGVDNIQKVTSISSLSRKHQYENWKKKLQDMYPLRREHHTINLPMFRIDESDMNVYVLKEKASIAFLKRYGHRIEKRFGKFHFSVGLVKDGVLYQVLRFEKHKDDIILVDFGTRDNYFNPNYYCKIMKAAKEITGIEEFSCVIPRYLANPELISSLQVELLEEGTYDVFWKLENGLKKATIRDDLSIRRDYVTSDYLDSYKHSNRTTSTDSPAVWDKVESPFVSSR